MHLVIIAWLFITLTMALTMSALEGLLFFGLAGLLPVLLYGWLAVQRHRVRRSSTTRPTHAHPPDE